MFRLVVYAGPTGGHLFPAQSFSEGFRKQFPHSRIDLVTSFRGKGLVASMPTGIFQSVYYLPEFGLPGGLSWQALKPFFMVPYLFFRSFFLFRKIKPHLCVGFGSFVAYPGMMMAHWLGIPTLIHEQNMIPGKATQWLAPHVDVVAESFERTKFSKKIKKTFTVGLPLRSQIINAQKNSCSGSLSRSFTVLVMGGSQGSRGLNTIVTDVFEKLSHEERAKIVVIHTAGKFDQEWVTKRYQELNLAYEVYSFYGSMNELFQRADLVICRAGANTLFELAAFGLPALVIPYPHAGGHQKYNAISFSEHGSLLFHEENSDAKIWLELHLKKFMKEPGLLEDMAKAMEKLAKPFAVEKLIEIAGSLIKEK
ncbi:MAG TPA: UDP-N-acetylglucosamine--N-acetylmuramyl-(pentapeptide) pyrophosphoryl-undecaprenol N-acetylglucosamine transferase [Candidatus Omnitrophota bacterium]|nr:UDP-N-acetylglucosamine--N-acetylmuramyl-(pentapeptide) pyrophosphoryl-undecaprenol N-acetylglucosamine transferase [Candidatus Omnitrophota bacterium]